MLKHRGRLIGSGRASSDTDAGPRSAGEHSAPDRVGQRLERAVKRAGAGMGRIVKHYA